MLAATSVLVADPQSDGIHHGLLRLDVDALAGHQLLHILNGQLEEVLSATDVLKVPLHKPVRRLLQLVAGIGVPELAEVDAVFTADDFLQELRHC